MPLSNNSGLSLAAIKEDFPVFREYPGLVYLDNAATTHKPDAMINTLVRFYTRENSNVHRAVHRLAERATVLFEDARSTVADFVNADPEQVIFTKGTTESLNLLAYSLSLSEEFKTFIVPQFEHHSNFVPWQQMSRRFGKEFIALDIRGTELELDTLEKAISLQKEAFVLAVSGLTNSTGFKLPVRQVVDMVHKNGGIVVIDGAQLIPHEQFDFKKSMVDFLAFSAHKMLGPTGIGALVGKRELLERLTPYAFGGEMIDKVDLCDTTFASIPQRFEAGTPNISGAMGFSSAINYLDGLNRTAVVEHIEKLTSLCHEELSSITGLRILSPGKSHGIVSFVHDSVHPHDLAEFLSQNLDVAIRSGHHCAQPQMMKLGVRSSCRASFYIYNTSEDVEALAKGIRSAVRWFG